MGRPVRIILIMLIGERYVLIVGKDILWAGDPELYKVEKVAEYWQCI